MANLHRHACLMAPLDASVMRLRRYLAKTAIGDAVTIVVRPHVLIPELNAEITLFRDVIVTLSAQEGGAFSWMPSDSGTFPRLIGAVHLVDEPPAGCRLVLVGDAAVTASPIGHRLNQAVAKAFLSHLAEQLR